MSACRDKWQCPSYVTKGGRALALVKRTVWTPKNEGIRRSLIPLRRDSISRLLFVVWFVRERVAAETDGQEAHPAHRWPNRDAA